MRTKVADGIWVDFEEFDKVTLKEFHRPGWFYEYNWLWILEVYEKNNQLIYSQTFIERSKAQELADKIYEVVYNKR